MSVARCRILLEDHDLVERLTGQQRSEAVRDCAARVLDVPAGAWSPAAIAPRVSSGIGLLVLTGLLRRRVGVDGRYGSELLGAGDLLRPWQREDNAVTLPRARGWQVLHPCRLAVLDRSFAARAGRYPEVTTALFARAVRRSRHLAVNMAIVHQPRVDVRLHMLFWELADRWGTVHGEFVRLPIRLTHAVLAELVAAQRSTVTTALNELAAQEKVRWAKEYWLLAGDPPLELGELAQPTTVPGRRPPPRLA
ncbi:MAG: helix-turn-helix domain-containing protein [Solirubrobacteraceae bacterium]